MIGLYLVLFLTLGKMLTLGVSPDKFKFTRWFAMPGMQEDRAYHFDAIDKVLNFYEAHPSEIDISAGLALILVIVNAESSKLYLDFIHEKFTDPRQLFDLPKEYEVLNDLIERIEQLLERFIDYMFARVPINNRFRKIISGFVLSGASWQENVKVFPLNVYTLEYSPEFADRWTVPSPAEYERALNNRSYITPTTAATVNCLQQLAESTTFSILYPQICATDDTCVEVVKNGDDFGYGLSNRILLLIYAKFARNCYFTSTYSDKELVVTLCSLARLEEDYLAEVMEYKIPGLIMEFMSYCSLNGHRQIMREQWYRDIDNQFSTSGDKRCYVRSEFKGMNPQLEDKYPHTAWELVRGTVKPLGPCDRHLTGLSLAAHAAAYRACYQPVFCTVDTDRCFAPYEFGLLRQEYLLFVNQDRWYPWQYMVGYQKSQFTECNGETVLTNNDLVTLTPVGDETPSTVYWLCRPPVSQYRDQPNSLH